MGLDEVMRRRDEGEEKPEQVVKAQFDPVNESVVLAAAMVDADARRHLVQVLRPEHFLVEQHRAAFEVIADLERRGLAFDFAALRQVAGDRVDTQYLVTLVDIRPDVPPPENLAHHVAAMHWDRQRAIAVQGPINSLLEALKNPSEAPERVRALARHVGESFTGSGRSFLRAPAEIVQSVVAGLQRRMAGHACYPYGIQGLDYYDEGSTNARGDSIAGRHRMIPGARPGQVTVVTALSGAGKSTFTAHVALGLAKQGRRVLYGAWEPGGDMTLELLACLALGWSRSDMNEGLFSSENLVELEEKAHEIAPLVTMMENPFRRQMSGKESNARNLDVVHQHVVDSGCDVFIADLWERCLVDDDPGEEKRALFRQQAMAVETKTHHILLAQQRSKDVETRADKRPTREGIKGSSAWVEVADTILAPHRPSLFKKVADDKLEVIVWKQRWGQWPLAVEFDWDPEFGSIERGRSLPFEHIGEQGGELAEFRSLGEHKGGGRKRRSRA